MTNNEKRMKQIEGDVMEKTLSAYRQLGPTRYRETSGLYYEDFEIGDTFEHRPGRTITDVDNIWITLLTLNVQPVHFDAAYAAKTEWKKDARRQHFNTRASNWHERPNRQRQSRRQPGMGQS